MTAWAVVGVVGYRGLTLGAPLIAAVLAAELAVIVLFDLVAFTHPADPGPAAWWAGWRPDLLATGGVGGVLAFGIAGFLGFETTAAFAEEALSPRSVASATRASLGFLGVFYAVAAWALLVAVGPDRIITTAQDPGSGIPFSILAAHLGGFGPITATVGIALLGGSVLGAMIAFHQVVARYLYGMAREHLLPARLAAVHTPRPQRTDSTGLADRRGPRRSGVPTAGSLTQTALALAVIVLAALVHADPISTVFTGLATLAALGLLTLMTATCLAVIAFYRPCGEHRTPRHGSATLGEATSGTDTAAWTPPQPPDHPLPAVDTAAAAEGRGRPGWWERAGAPGAGAAALATALAVTLANLGPTLADPTGTAPVLLPLLIAVAAGCGARRAWWLRRHHRAAYAALGNGQPPPLAIRDPAIADLEL